MKSFNIKGYTITHPKDMLITINEEKDIVAAVDREAEIINFILEFLNDDVWIESIWGIKYMINNKNIYLEYSSIAD